jgi:hypothetical protein
MVGIHVHDIFPPDHVAQMMADIDQVVTSNTGLVKEVEAEIAGIDNWFRTSIQPVRSESGIPYAVFIYSTNIRQKILIHKKTLKNFTLRGLFIIILH